MHSHFYNSTMKYFKNFLPKKEIFMQEISRHGEKLPVIGRNFLSLEEISVERKPKQNFVKTLTQPQLDST